MAVSHKQHEPVDHLIHDPRLRLLELEAQLGQYGSERHKGALGLALRPAQHQQIIGVTHQHTAPARPPDPVEPVQGDVAQQRRDNTTLRRTGHAAPDRALLHHPRAQQRTHQLEQLAVTDPLLNRRHQPVVRNRLETRGDVRLYHPAPAFPGLIDQDLQGIVRRASRAKPERALEEVGLEDRLDRRLQRRLHDPVADSGDRKRPLLRRTGLRDEDPARRQRSIALRPQIRGQLVEQPLDPVLLDLREAALADRRAGEGLPSSRRHLPNVPRPIRREVPRGRTPRLFAPSTAFTRTSTGSAPPPPPPKGRVLTTRQASLHAADRSVAPPEALSTLGSDPARLQTEPPACYRASWQPPGRDSHPLATTSLRWIRSPHNTTSNSGRTKKST